MARPLRQPGRLQPPELGERGVVEGQAPVAAEDRRALADLVQRLVLRLGVARCSCSAASSASVTSSDQTPTSPPSSGWAVRRKARRRPPAAAQRTASRRSLAARRLAGEIVAAAVERQAPFARHGEALGAGGVQPGLVGEHRRAVAAGDPGRRGARIQEGRQPRRRWAGRPRRRRWATAAGRSARRRRAPRPRRRRPGRCASNAQGAPVSTSAFSWAPWAGSSEAILATTACASHPAASGRATPSRSAQSARLSSPAASRAGPALRDRTAISKASAAASSERAVPASVAGAPSAGAPRRPPSAQTVAPTASDAVPAAAARSSVDRSIQPRPESELPSIGVPPAPRMAHDSRPMARPKFRR